jgi:hypothetical protein
VRTDANRDRSLSHTAQLIIDRISAAFFREPPLLKGEHYLVERRDGVRSNQEGRCFSGVRCPPSAARMTSWLLGVALMGLRTRARPLQLSCR